MKQGEFVPISDEEKKIKVVTKTTKGVEHTPDDVIAIEKWKRAYRKAIASSDWLMVIRAKSILHRSFSVNVSSYRNGSPVSITV